MIIGFIHIGTISESHVQIHQNIGLNVEDIHLSEFDRIIAKDDSCAKGGGIHLFHALGRLKMRVGPSHPGFCSRSSECAVQIMENITLELAIPDQFLVHIGETQVLGCNGDTVLTTLADIFTGRASH